MAGGCHRQPLNESSKSPSRAGFDELAEGFQKAAFGPEMAFFRNPIRKDPVFREAVVSGAKAILFSIFLRSPMHSGLTRRFPSSSFPAAESP